MIKRENIKQAIDAISERDPEIGYSLNEMLGMGQIDVPLRGDQISQGDDLHFLFDNQKVFVKKILFFNEGTVPIEQRLLIKYGELTKKQELQDREEPIDYRQAAMEIQKAGLKLMVIHEIDYAIERLRRRPGILETNIPLPDDEFPSIQRAARSERLISFLEKIKRDNRTLDAVWEGDELAVLYRGVVDDAEPAHFIHFPFCMDSLMQVADINLEFFHVRFLLNTLARGLERNLFVCLVRQRIVGLIYLTFKDRMFHKGLEIKFIATLRGKTGHETEQAPRVPKGIGVFLVSGAWLVWKSEFAHIKEISLDSEIGARGFYAAVGFQPRGLSEYVLKTPKGRLLKAILIMANNCQDLKQGVVEEIGRLIKKQVKSLRKKARSEKERSARKVAIASVKECLKSEARLEFAKAAMGTLSKYEKKIPESRELVRFASEQGSEDTKANQEDETGSCH